MRGPPVQSGGKQEAGNNRAAEAKQRAQEGTAHHFGAALDIFDLVSEGLGFFLAAREGGLMSFAVQLPQAGNDAHEAGVEGHQKKRGGGDEQRRGKEGLQDVHHVEHQRALYSNACPPSNSRTRALQMCGARPTMAYSLCRWFGNKQTFRSPAEAAGLRCFGMNPGGAGQSENVKGEPRLAFLFYGECARRQMEHEHQRPDRQQCLVLR